MTTALETANRVLVWCGRPSGPPPLGGMGETTGLAAPEPGTLARLRDMAAHTGARLGAGRSRLGDDGCRLGLGALLLAAAVGARGDRKVALRLAEAAAETPGRGWTDQLCRYAVLRPVLEPRRGAVSAFQLEPALIDALLRAATLTQVLHRPADGTDGVAVGTAAELLSRPRGPAVLAGVLAAPHPDAAVRRWRGELLDRFRHAHRSFVIDVYVLARLRHAAEWDRLVGADRPDPSTARYWAPLAAIDADPARPLAARPFLDGHQSAVALARALNGGNLT
ncbi:hypothetical protein ACTOB_003067 [Actinoplanes oblitus]|uniref:FtsH ternary system domain-containing protein n=1 Tax=Actinoplanes oblitus TaxID=3040509 RepID=A0ABY8WNG5_9ACTN|nr:hypothetical protein [Actinoplanes oblitus]WIM99416.1 hypothetical protein ACTOB_003067 [Actinoplanes oblitus]